MISYKNDRKRKRREVLWRQAATFSGRLATMRERSVAVCAPLADGLTRRRAVDYCRVAAAL